MKSLDILIRILILCFIILLLYQTYNYIYCNIYKEPLFYMEGFQTEYVPYNKDGANGALILAQQNAGNIEFLKQRMDKIDNLQQKITDIDKNVKDLNEQVRGLIEAQSTYAKQSLPSETPEISGVM